VSNQRIAAIILTKNEERDLPACLESLHGLTSEIHVVDSGSDDRTAVIAREFGASVTFHPFTNQAQQFNWALGALSIGAGWVLRIDADERVTPELASSLVGLLPRLRPGVNGVLLPRRIHFLGRPIRWGDSYPVWILRLFRRGTGKSEEAWMDEHIILDEGTVVKAQGDLIHEIPKSLSEWIRKHDRYADRECKDILGVHGDAPRLPEQPGARRALKQGLYLKLPPFARAFLYWIYRYFLKLGFLDGKEGLIYHFLHAFWYRFLVDAKLYELKKAVSVPESGAASARTF